MVKKSYYKVKVLFIEPLLGSQTTRSITSEFIAKRNGFATPEDELETLPDALEKGTTVFHRDPTTGRPFLTDYQVKGFLKNAGQVLNGRIHTGNGVIKNTRSKVLNNVFISPRRIPITYRGEITYNERPLRAETAQGPRVALARSEQIDGGVIEFGVTVYDGEISEEVLRDLFDFGFDCGMGQWRTGGWGSFRYTLVKQHDDTVEEVDVPIDVSVAGIAARKAAEALSVAAD